MFQSKIFDIKTACEFEETALEIFRFQYENIPVYGEFCKLLNRTPSRVQSLQEIPFLPIDLFKTHRILPKDSKYETIFTSSGTTGQIISKHYIADLNLYEESFLRGFERVYGSPKKYVFLALLPSYLEREGSSLIYMADRLIKESGNEHSGFYLNDYKGLIKKIHLLEEQQQPAILLGVSYALLDLLDLENFNLHHTLIMETGGMKGRRREMIKEELHEILKQGFGVDKIHSEYGMTELLSQAYSKGDGIFCPPTWMKILTRDPEDALTYIEGKTGGINVIDLANIYSCAFIATQDLGKIQEKNRFEIVGRFDFSDIRGCNLMVL